MVTLRAVLKRPCWILPYYVYWDSSVGPRSRGNEWYGHRPFWDYTWTAQSISLWLWLCKKCTSTGVGLGPPGYDTVSSGEWFLTFWMICFLWNVTDYPANDTSSAALPWEPQILQMWRVLLLANVACVTSCKCGVCYLLQMWHVLLLANVVCVTSCKCDVRYFLQMWRVLLLANVACVTSCKCGMCYFLQMWRALLLANVTCVTRCVISEGHLLKCNMAFNLSN